MHDSRVLSVAIAFVAMLLGFSHAEAQEPSRVMRIRMPAFVEGRYDVEIVLHHQTGRFHHGYALVPARDNILHRIDVVPAKPIAWRDRDGAELVVPDHLRGSYAYKYSREEFRAWKQKYEDGEVRIIHPVAVPPLQWEDGHLTGTLDIEILDIDSSRGGRSRLGATHRLVFDLAGEPLAGRVTTWHYDARALDETYGADAPRRVLDATAHWDDRAWDARPGTELAEGHAWPGSTGSLHTGAALDHDGTLVTNLHDARLVWVAEDLLPGGTGMTRGGFALRPFPWTGFAAADAFGSPAVADNRVFLYTSQPDVEHLAHHPPPEGDNAFYRLGIKAAVFGRRADVVSAYDARTGRRLWRHAGGAAAAGNQGKGKSTNGVTPLVVGERVLVRGAAALYALDAADGRLLWEQRRIGKVDLTLDNTHGSSVDGSPSLIGQTVVIPVGRDGGLAGVNPEDGTLRWHHPHVIGYNQVPSPVRLDGKEFLLAVGGTSGTDRAPTTRLLDPDDGRIFWSSTEAAVNVGNVTLHGTTLAANARSGSMDGHRYAGFRVTADGLQRLWENGELHRMGGRQVPVGHRGVLYSDSRRTGFSALDMDSGKTIRRHAASIPGMTHGSHNWSWTVAGNDRVLTSGVLLFSTAETGFHLLPGRLTIDLKNGYVCPVKPAFVDGRLFLRTDRGLVCYDLRAPAERDVQMARIHVEGAFADGQDIELLLRDVRGGRRTLATRIPPRHGAEASLVNNWVAHVARPLDWKATPMHPADVAWEEDGLRGSMQVNVGWHREDWTLALARSGNRLQGQITRSATPLEEPEHVAGTVGGRRVGMDDEGRTIHELDLQEAVRRPDAEGDRNSLYVVLVEEDNRIVHAWASAGRLNANNHEVDFGALSLSGSRIEGRITVLFHDDQFVDLHPGNRLLAASFSIEAKMDGDGISGRHTGRIGVDWSKTAPAAGVLERESEDAILRVANPAEPPEDTE